MTICYLCQTPIDSQPARYRGEPVCDDCIDESTVSREDLLEQAEKVLSLVDASMYYSVAHGEVERLQDMIDEYVEEQHEYNP